MHFILKHGCKQLYLMTWQHSVVILINAFQILVPVHHFIPVAMPIMVEITDQLLADPLVVYAPYTTISIEYSLNCFLNLFVLTLITVIVITQFTPTPAANAAFIVSMFVEFDFIDSHDVFLLPLLIKSRGKWNVISHIHH